MNGVDAAQEQRWTLDSIDWGAVRIAAVRDTEPLFYLVAAASFMETATDRYTANLIEQFRGDGEVTDWLISHWLPEETQHGAALRRYVEIAWPDFAWDRVYTAFLAEFESYCSLDGLEPTRAREMASRCVVETGTASYYTTLSRLAVDPVLASIARRIAADEIRHYKHFYRYFRRYREAEAPSRGAVLGALWNRLRMIDGDDSIVTLKHLHRARHPAASFDAKVYAALRRGSRQLIRPNFPHRMCVQMLLKPLGLGPRSQRIAVPIAAALAQRVVP